MRPTTRPTLTPLATPSRRATRPTPTDAGDPLAALRDQILADLDASQVARARTTIAALRRR